MFRWQRSSFLAPYPVVENPTSRDVRKGALVPIAAMQLRIKVSRADHGQRSLRLCAKDLQGFLRFERLRPGSKPLA